jgi:hypothetical protein
MDRLIADVEWEESTRLARDKAEPRILPSAAAAICKMHAAPVHLYH